MLDEIEIRHVRDLADQLDERERAVIRAHYGLGEPARTLNEIGGALGLTAERARQIEVGALQRLRDALTSGSGRYAFSPVRAIRRQRDTRGTRSRIG